MKDNYILFHKDIPCGVLSVDRDSGALSDFALTDKEHAPFLGNADERLMKIWWKHRAVPGTRKDIEEAIRNAGCESNEEYLAKNLALSLTDTYWICPADIELSWSDVNLYSRKDYESDLLAYRGGTSYDPNASLGGDMDKYWDISGEIPVLTKKAFRNFGQQSVNEAFASHLHCLQRTDIPFVSYETCRQDDGAVLSMCKSFTSENTEFVSAYEVVRSAKKRQNRSDFDHYLDICEDHGLDRDVLQRSMDYMLLSDYSISNIDEHLENFGVLRDVTTMELIGPAPLFDSGNSMFFDLPVGSPLSRVDLMGLEINSIHKREDQMLKHITDRSILDFSSLPTRDEAAEFFECHGIPGSRAEFIADSYANKLSLLRDFQKGISISLFHEKH